MIAPAVIRLYARAREIECEVDQALDDQALDAGICDDDPDERELARAKTRAAALARHREYRWTRAELGRLLGLGPPDVNPLDGFDLEREGADDAIELRIRLDRELIRWWRRGARPGGDLAVVGLDDAAVR